MSDAVRSLFGSGKRPLLNADGTEMSALHKNTQTTLIRSSAGSPNERPTRIHTPQILLDVVAAVWPEGIALDPAGSPDGKVQAARIVIPPEDGLTIDWPERTYVNPPYSNLRPWLEKHSASWEVLTLVRVAMGMSRIVFLNPITFDGIDPKTGLQYAQSFPAPLCFLYRGRRFHVLTNVCYQMGVTA